MGGLAAAQAATYALYESNAAALREILADRDRRDLWARRLADWILTEAPGGFRWHVSGDLFSEDHAEWVGDVAWAAGGERGDGPVQWIYTRSFDLLGPLLRSPHLCNLSVNLSCDRDNYDAAVGARNYWRLKAGAELRLCYLVVEGDEVPTDLHDEDVIFPDYDLRPKGLPTLADSPWWQSLEPRQRGLVCPVDAHGKSERRRCGPCDRCMVPNCAPEIGGLS